MKDQNKGTYENRGHIERTSETTLRITELPLKKWTQDYKQFVELMLTGDGGKKTPEIKDFKENHTDTTVDFTIIADKEMIDKFEKEKDGLYGKFKLTGSLAISNMHLFDREGKILKYDSPLNVLETFYGIRLEFYHRRKESLVEKLEAEQRMLSNKARFVEEVCSGSLVVSNRKRHEILTDLQERKFDLIYKSTGAESSSESSSNEGEDDATVSELAKGYEYLLGMKIWSLTYERAQALRNEFSEKTEELRVLQETSPSQIWLNDLDSIEEALAERDAETNQVATQAKLAQKKGQKRQAIVAKKLAAKKKPSKKDAWDSDLEDSSDDDGGISLGSDSEVEALPKPKPKPIARKPVTVKPPVAKTAAKSLAKEASPVLASTSVKIAKSTSSTPTIHLESSDDEEELSLAERMKRKLKAPSAPSSPPKKHHSQHAEDTNNIVDMANLKPADVSPVKTKRVLARKDGNAKMPVKKTTKKKASIMEDSDSDEFAFQSDSEPADMIKIPIARSRRGGARKTAYVVDEESSGDEF